MAIILALVMLWATLYKRDVLVPALSGLLPGVRSRSSPQEVVIDASAVIDGRIVDIGRTGFILGTLVVPRFVLDELQRIADSPDALRLNRGRRGLEMLAALQRDSVARWRSARRAIRRSTRSTPSWWPTPATPAPPS